MPLFLFAFTDSSKAVKFAKEKTKFEPLTLCQDNANYKSIYRCQHFL